MLARILKMGTYIYMSFSVPLNERQETKEYTNVHFIQLYMIYYHYQAFKSWSYFIKPRQDVDMTWSQCLCSRFALSRIPYLPAYVHKVNKLKINYAVYRSSTRSLTMHLDTIVNIKPIYPSRHLYFYPMLSSI